MYFYYFAPEDALAECNRALTELHDLLAASEAGEEDFGVEQGESPV